MVSSSTPPLLPSSTPVLEVDGVSARTETASDRAGDLYRLSRHERSEVIAAFEEFAQGDFATLEDVAAVKRKHGLT